MQRSAGVSLVEVLVSIVVLSVALLGSAGLMGASLKSTNTAYYRSQATVMADDILDRMRANIEAARSGNYDIADGPSYSAPSGSLARYDCEEWIGMLASTFPGGTGEVDVEDGQAEITITWNDDQDSFLTRTRLGDSP